METESLTALLIVLGVIVVVGFMYDGGSKVKRDRSKEVKRPHDNDGGGQ